MQNKFEPFSVPFNGRLLRGDKVPGKPPILFLHGAGQSTREFFNPIRENLFLNHLPSVAFDFIGHGETGGNLVESSLKERSEQASAVIETLGLASPLSIVAASMSGYTAIKLLEKYEIAKLALIVPAVYHADAYAVAFNRGFSEIIRQPRSWLHTDAWGILKQFKGDLLIIKAEKDAVIPEEVLTKIYESANQARTKAIHVVRESPHKILDFLPRHPHEEKLVCEQILSCLQS